MDSITVPNTACVTQSSLLRGGVFELSQEESVIDYQPRSGPEHSVWGKSKIFSEVIQRDGHIVHSDCQER